MIFTPSVALRAFRLSVLLLTLFILMSCATAESSDEPLAAVRPEDAPPDDSFPDPADAPPDSRIERTEDLREQVLAALRAGETEAAGDLLEQLGPAESDPALWLVYANMLLQDGRTSVARDIFGRLSIHETDIGVAARYLLGRTSATPDEQRAWFESALEADPEHAGANAGLGLLALAADRRNEAEEYFQTARIADPENLSALRGLSDVARTRGRPREALPFLDTALDVAPDAGFLHSDRGAVLAALRRVDEAVASFGRAIELEPDVAWHYYDAGRALQEAGRIEDSLSYFNEAIERDNSVFLFYFHRASVYYVGGDHERALDDYRVVLEMRSDYRPAYAPYATALFMNQEFAGAARYYERVFVELHREPTFGLLTGLSHRLAGQSARAASWFEQVRRLAGADSLYAQIAVEFVNPRSDDTTLRRIRRESDPRLRARLSFYLGALYATLGRRLTAEALLLDVVDSDMQGSIETELAQWFLEHYDYPGR